MDDAVKMVCKGVVALRLRHEVDAWHIYGTQAKLWPLSYTECGCPAATGNLDSCSPRSDRYLRRSLKRLSSCATELHALESEKGEERTVIIDATMETLLCLATAPPNLRRSQVAMP